MADVTPLAPTSACPRATAGRSTTCCAASAIAVGLIAFVALVAYVDRDGYRDVSGDADRPARRVLLLDGQRDHDGLRRHHAGRRTARGWSRRCSSRPRASCSSSSWSATTLEVLAERTRTALPREALEEDLARPHHRLRLRRQGPRRDRDAARARHRAGRDRRDRRARGRGRGGAPRRGFAGIVGDASSSHRARGRGRARRGRGDRRARPRRQRGADHAHRARAQPARADRRLGARAGERPPARAGRRGLGRRLLRRRRAGCSATPSTARASCGCWRTCSPSARGST